jgi:hypothetical protein
MSWLQTAAAALRFPDPRPLPVLEQEILDELKFHLDMRTLDNLGAGMSAEEARQAAVRRFGDFDRIRKTCRRIILGERIMLQRVQAIVTVVLLGAVIALGVEFYRGQRANEAATARIMQVLDQLAGPWVVAAVPNNGQTDVDPSLTEIRVTYSKEMMDGSWSWCFDPKALATTGEPRYESDRKTCVLPVKLAPGKSYAIRCNSGDFRNFKDAAGQPAIPYLLEFKTRQ